MPEQDTAVADASPLNSERRRSVFIISDQPWWTRSLQSILDPHDYHTSPISMHEAGFDRILGRDPDAVLVHLESDLAQAQKLGAVIAGLRHINGQLPVLAVSERILTRDERLAVLRAGAWDCIAPVFDAEELLLKLETLCAAKRAADRSRLQALIDGETGFYSAAGLLKRATELSDAAARYRHPLACAVFSVSGGNSDNAQEQASSPAIHAAVSLFQSGARGSDVVSRLGVSEFALLAPETDSTGIVTAANRFVRIYHESSGGLTALRAGCYAAEDLHVTPMSPGDLVMCATTALRQAQAGSTSMPVCLFTPLAAN